MQVAVAYSALRHLNPEVAKGLGVRIHQTFGFRLWQICLYEKSSTYILETIISTCSVAVGLGSQMDQISKNIFTTASWKANYLQQLEETRLLFAKNFDKLQPHMGILFATVKKGLLALANSILIANRLGWGCFLEPDHVVVIWSECSYWTATVTIGATSSHW